MNVIRTIVLAFLTLSITAVATRAASAATQEMSTIAGGACVPTSQTIQEGLYETRGWGVGFKPGRTGRIRLMCPVLLISKFFSDGHYASTRYFTLSFIDGDRDAGAANVTVRLGHGYSTSNASEWSGICDSNTDNVFPTRTISYAKCDRDVQIVWGDFFWFDVEITRTNADVEVEFLGSSIGYKY